MSIFIPGCCVYFIIRRRRVLVGSMAKTLVPGTNVVKKASNLDILTLKPENGYKEPDVSAIFL